MSATFTINLAELPELGNQLTGEISPSVFELKEQEGTPLTGLQYDLFVQRFDTELLIRGKISTLFDLQCVRTLHPFQKTITVSDLSLSLQITEEIVDITEQLREEIMILLPIYPVCDMADEKMTCSVEEKYLALDKEDNSDLEEKPAESSDDRWAALDKLDNLDNS